MLKKDLIFRNPLRLMGDHTEEILPVGGFGAVLARAGVGKTALLVQIALERLISNNDVLHLSLNDPIDKTCLWYKEVFQNTAKQANVSQTSEIWDNIRRHRFVMAFEEGEFNVAKFESRLLELTEQEVLNPKVILVDGLSFDDESVGAQLKELKELATKNELRVWFAIRTHRHEDPGPSGIPSQLSVNKDLFEAAIQLLPEGKEINVKILKGGTPSDNRPALLLDPATMLIKNA